jgi:hypothetical protein
MFDSRCSWNSWRLAARSTRISVAGAEELGEHLVGQPQLLRQALPERPVEGETEALVAVDLAEQALRIEGEQLRLDHRHRVSRAREVVDEAGLAQQVAGSEQGDREHPVWRPAADLDPALLDQVGVDGLFALAEESGAGGDLTAHGAAFQLGDLGIGEMGEVFPAAERDEVAQGPSIVPKDPPLWCLRGTTKARALSYDPVAYIEAPPPGKAGKYLEMRFSEANPQVIR